MRVIATTAYERQAKRVLTGAERTAAEAHIAARPDAWPVIPGTVARERTGSPSATEGDAAAGG